MSRRRLQTIVVRIPADVATVLDDPQGWLERVRATLSADADLRLAQGGLRNITRSAVWALALPDSAADSVETLRLRYGDGPADALAKTVALVPDHAAIAYRLVEVIPVGTDGYAMPLPAWATR